MRRFCSRPRTCDSRSFSRTVLFAASVALSGLMLLGCGNGADPMPITSPTTTTTTPPIMADAGGSCVGDEDCPGGTCRAGLCSTLECVQNSECARGRCIANRCTTIGCSRDTDCISGRCVSGMCMADECTEHDDCSLTGRCVEGSCQAPECTIDSECENGICDSGSCRVACTMGSECSSGVCANSRCQLPSCTDQVRNGDESDIDCGGTLCARCEAGEACSNAADCDTRSCTNMVCGVSSCTDGILNGDETSTDCGGTCPNDCAIGERCRSGSDCSSTSCVGATCVEPSCTDGQRNRMETDIDCGGPSCGRCANGSSCSVDGDCVSATCESGTCRAPACDDGRANGMETDVDCGGVCPNTCAQGLRCSAHTDCATSTCVNNLCVPPSCNDMVQNQDETDVDCGGQTSMCSACDDGLQCNRDEECLSLRCVSNVCDEASCTDQIENGYESDVDCGGTLCDPCERGEVCNVDSDCVTELCRGGQCVIAPTAGFTLSTTTGDVPLVVVATSGAMQGDAALTIEYDWGDGFGSADQHRFTRTGSYPVVQRVTDAYGLVATAMTTVTATGIDPIVLSAASVTPNTIVLLEDGLACEMRNTLSPGGVRTETSIAPGQGVFYFESTKLTTAGFYGGGVTTATSGFVGFAETPDSFGIQTYGAAVSSSGTTQFLPAPLGDTTGFVIDYRNANPTVYMVYEGDGTVRVIQHVMTGVTEPLYAAFMGVINEHGPMNRFNFGADTTNHDFRYDVRAELTSAGFAEVARALVLGFGRTSARPPTTPPMLVAPADMSAPVGIPITLSASAMDEEDGALTSSIEWEVEADGYYIRRRGSGGSFTFTPNEVGVYPISVSVEDSLQVRTERQFRITVSGDVPQFDPVRLVAHEGSGRGIEISSDGLQSRYTVDLKGGMRANQGMYGEFQYFEVSRLFFPASNIGCGVIIGQGSIDPLSFATTQPSLQVNFLGSIWKDLIHQEEIGAIPDAVETFGFAVDYTDIHPVVHVISHAGLQRSVTLQNAWLPVYPMVYGNPVSSTSPPAYDSSINFGASPFVLDPVQALTQAGVPNLARLEVGWGDANTP